MSEGTSTRGRKANLPISFRMPGALRSRLRRFAEERSLGEAEAIRLALSERLNEIDDERDLTAAERWQFEQAYGTWQKLKAGTEKLVSQEDIDRVFDRARPRRGTRRDKEAER